MQSKLSELNNCCRISSTNALRATRWDKPIDPPSFLNLSFKEEHLETSNTLTINRVEDSNQIIVSTTMVVITTKEIQTDSTLEEEVTTISQTPPEA